MRIAAVAATAVRQAGQGERGMTAATATIHESAQLPGDVLGFASWSADRWYRWSLRRAWTGPAGGPSMTWIMLNPSTAGAANDDASIRRCSWFARREGCTSMTVVNLFALASTDPRGLLADPDPVGWACDQAILDGCTACHEADPERLIVVVAWGASAGHPKLRQRAADVLDMLDSHHVGYMALGLTKNHHPLHPLRLRRDTPLGVMSTRTAASSRAQTRASEPASSKTAPAHSRQAPCRGRVLPPDE
jgi:hypothetical protein